MYLLFKLLFIFTLILGIQSTLCQERYIPIEVYDKNSKELKQQIRNHEKEILDEKGINDDLIYYEDEYARTYHQITDYIINQINESHYIKYPLTENIINNIYQEILSSNPEIKPVKKILLLRDGFANASYHGQGTVSLNIGLITQLESEGELAFVLAHETAHRHLDHIHQRLEKFLNNRELRKVNSRFNKIPQGAFSLEDLKFVQEWFNALGKFSREEELQADSLALLMIQRVGYSPNDAIGALGKLKPYIPKSPLKSALFDELIFEEIPFKRRWLEPQLKIYSAELGNPLFNTDSTMSHPDHSMRISTLKKLRNSDERNRTNSQYSEFIQKLELERAQSFYFTKYLDCSLHQSLQLKKKYPNDSYLDFNIARILYQVSLAKAEKRLHTVVPRYTPYYDLETRVINNFLYNLLWTEAGELSYFYLKKHFDQSNPDHYRLLLQISNFTKRREESNLIKKTFKLSFPDLDISKYSDERD